MAAQGGALRQGYVKMGHSQDDRMFSFTRRSQPALFDAILAATEARDAAGLMKAVEAVKAFRNAGSDALFPWALLHLDAWGLEACLRNDFPDSTALQSFFVRLFNPTWLENPQEHLRLKTEAWPVLWSAAQTQESRLHQLLSEVFLAHHQEQPFDLSLLDLPDGPFSEPFHDHLVSCQPRRQIWVGKFTPMQLAWANQDFCLMGLLLKKGADLDRSYPTSSWPLWTLRSALERVDSPAGPQLSEVEEYGPRELLKNAAKSYTSEERLLLAQTIRVGLLDHQLPSPHPRRALPRF